jgi:hypothetical protein
MYSSGRNKPVVHISILKMTRAFFMELKCTKVVAEKLEDARKVTSSVNERKVNQ